MAWKFKAQTRLVRSLPCMHVTFVLACRPHHVQLTFPVCLKYIFICHAKVNIFQHTLQ